MIFVFLKKLITHPRTNLGGVDDVEAPVHRERKLAAGLERLRRDDAHHCLHDHVFERFSGGILHRRDIVPAIKFLRIEQSIKLVEGLIVQSRRGAGLMRHHFWIKQVLIQLHPQIIECVLRVVVIGNCLTAEDAVIRLIEFHIDHVIGLLLPIARPRRPRSPALRVRRGPHIIQLLKRITRRSRCIGKREHSHQSRAQKKREAFQHRKGSDVPEPHQKSNARDSLVSQLSKQVKDLDVQPH